VPCDEFQRVVIDDVGSVLTLRVVFSNTIDFKAGVGVARRAAGVLPQAMFVKTEFLRQVQSVAELPLACDARRVAGIFEMIADGDRLRVQRAKAQIIPRVGATGHQLHARWRAQRLCITTGEARTPGRKPVENFEVEIG